MIGRWKRRSGDSGSSSEPVRVELGPSRRAEVVRLLADDKRIEAVKAARVGTDLSLLEAVRAVDALAARLADTGPKVQLTVTLTVEVEDPAALRAAVANELGSTTPELQKPYSVVSSDVELLIEPGRLVEDLPGVRLLDSATSCSALGPEDENHD